MFSSSLRLGWLFQRRYEIDLKRDLIIHYREHESTVPVSPLVENHDVPLEEFYVQPPMLAFDKPHIMSKEDMDLNKSKQCNLKTITSSSPKKISVSSYRGLLLDKNNTPYKHIYISAQAGSGKTSFSKQLASSWCQAMSSTNLSLENDDIAVLKMFDFLFLIHLRDFQSTELCNVEDMIWELISRQLIGSDQYSKQLVQKILRESRCLIVIDGLDEWSHANKNCSRKEKVPHLKPYPMCTTLTTTRPWKLSAISLESNQIDRHVDITNLDYKTICRLGNNALNILNKIHNTKIEENKMLEFLENMYSTESGEIITVPYVLLQFICLWHDGREIGRSRCEIYSSMIDITLERGLKRTDLPEMVYPEHGACTVPKCMINTNVCSSHLRLMSKLGMLAFFSLFNENKESTLIIDYDTVIKYLVKQELDFFLKIGLLSQSKDIKFVSKESFKVYFNHKTIQEFFAALYISSTWQNEATKDIFRSACKQVSDILEFSSVIIFVCGINSDVYSSLSLECQNIVANDILTLNYRLTAGLSEINNIFRCTEDSISSCTLMEYQLMQVSCLQEHKRNNNDEIAIPLQDIILVDDILMILNEHSMSVLNELIKCNESNVKSLFVSASNVSLNYTEILQMIKGCRSLQSVYWKCDAGDILANILADSASTMNCITISQVSISKTVTDSITNLNSLQRISFWNYPTISHSDMKKLFVYLGHTNTLRYITLDYLCTEIDWKRPGLSLDLSNNNQLQRLSMPHADYLCEVHVNTDCLEGFELRAINSILFSADTSKALIAALQGAPMLSVLTLCHLDNIPDMLVKNIPTLLHLKILTLRQIKFGDNFLSLPTSMTRLEHLTLELIDMTTSGWRKLIDSVFRLLQHVTVELEHCYGPSVKEWKDIQAEIMLLPVSLEERMITGKDRATMRFKTIKV